MGKHSFDGRLSSERFATPAGVGIGSIVIIGGGAAGLACAKELRTRGFAGDVTILSADSGPAM